MSAPNQRPLKRDSWRPNQPSHQQRQQQGQSSGQGPQVWGRAPQRDQGWQNRGDPGRGSDGRQEQGDTWDRPAGGRSQGRDDEWRAQGKRKELSPERPRANFVTHSERERKQREERRHGGRESEPQNYNGGGRDRDRDRGRIRGGEQNYNRPPHPPNGHAAHQSHANNYNNPLNPPNPSPRIHDQRIQPPLSTRRRSSPDYGHSTRDAEPSRDGPSSYASKQRHSRADGPRERSSDRHQQGPPMKKRRGARESPDYGVGGSSRDDASPRRSLSPSTSVLSRSRDRARSPALSHRSHAPSQSHSQSRPHARGHSQSRTHRQRSISPADSDRLSTASVWSHRGVERARERERDRDYDRGRDRRSERGHDSLRDSDNLRQDTPHFQSRPHLPQSQPPPDVRSDNGWSARHRGGPLPPPAPFTPTPNRFGPGPGSREVPSGPANMGSGRGFDNRRFDDPPRSGLSVNHGSGPGPSGPSAPRNTSRDVPMRQWGRPANTGGDGHRDERPFQRDSSPTFIREPPRSEESNRRWSGTERMDMDRDAWERPGPGYREDRGGDDRAFEREEAEKYGYDRIRPPPPRGQLPSRRESPEPLGRSGYTPPRPLGYSVPSPRHDMSPGAPAHTLPPRSLSPEPQLSYPSYPSPPQPRIPVEAPTSFAEYVHRPSDPLVSIPEPEAQVEEPQPLQRMEPLKISFAPIAPLKAKTNGNTEGKGGWKSLSGVGGVGITPGSGVEKKKLAIFDDDAEDEAGSGLVREEEEKTEVEAPSEKAEQTNLPHPDALIHRLTLASQRYNTLLSALPNFLRTAFDAYATLLPSPSSSASSKQPPPVDLFLDEFLNKRATMDEISRVEEVRDARVEWEAQEEEGRKYLEQVGKGGIVESSEEQERQGEEKTVDAGPLVEVLAQPTPAPSDTSAQPQLEPVSVPEETTPLPVYQKITHVGEGTYGKVYKARSTLTGQFVALKRIRMEGEKDGFPVTAMREIKLLQALRDDNVLKLLEMTVEKGSVYMVLEYMDHDLTGLLAHPTFRFTPANIKSLSHQMLAGLSCLHHHSILHRDLKGGNILINSRGELKLADFGLARGYEKDRGRGRREDYTNRVVTLWYRSPELLLGETMYGPEVDMWSAGCIILELYTTKPIFQGNDEIHQLETIYSIMGTPKESEWPGVKALPWYELVKPKEVVGSKFRSSFAKWLSPAGLDLVEGLLFYDPSKRLSADSALKTPYFTSEDPPMEKPTQLEGMGEHHEMTAKAEKRRRRMEEGQSRQGS
ncbi:hypothetical protein IAR50_002536 [Cryptococcus sp. DSM 104548]